MCGIFGILNMGRKTDFNIERFEASLLKMNHRGPDGHAINQVTENLLLGHVRLAIIDVGEENRQPFCIDDNYWIIYNGEIYNYIELRNELKSLGYSFRTKGDTEVLLRAYQHWGSKCVNRFNGDWSFAIFNKQENTLFCSRDRFGVKPFNYAFTNDCFIFASEIKPIINYFEELKKPDYNIISNYCRNSLGAQTEQTWFAGIKRLPPAHNIIFYNGTNHLERYWNYPPNIDHKIKFSEAKEEYKNIFIDSTKLRMRSDVPVGATLSSGLDSSSIVAVLNYLQCFTFKTFTADMDGSLFKTSEFDVYKNTNTINETDLVKDFSERLRLDSDYIIIPKNDFVEDLGKVIYSLESGHSSPAILPLSHIYSHAKSFVKVVLEGQGADELLGGYIINHFPLVVFELIKQGNISAAYSEYKLFSDIYSVKYSLKQFLRLANSQFMEKGFHLLLGYNKVFGDKLKSYQRLNDYPENNQLIEEVFARQLLKSHTGGLVNLLHYGDAISMSHSVESRLPFLDVNLVEFVFKLPYNFKIKNGFGKYIHREAMEGIVPENILKNRLKYGFNTPLASKFENLNSEAVKILLSDRCVERGIYNKAGLLKFINEHISKKWDHSSRLFRLLSVELWFRKFIDI